jgi:hypothetical protein
MTSTDKIVESHLTENKHFSLKTSYNKRRSYLFSFFPQRILGEPFCAEKKNNNSNINCYASV